MNNHTTYAVAKSVFKVAVSDRPGQVCERHRLCGRRARQQARAHHMGRLERPETTRKEEHRTVDEANRTHHRLLR